MKNHLDLDESYMDMLAIDAESGVPVVIFLPLV
jgi:hypothetical protein